MWVPIKMMSMKGMIIITSIVRQDSLETFCWAAAADSALNSNSSGPLNSKRVRHQNPTPRGCAPPAPAAEKSG